MRHSFKHPGQEVIEQIIKACEAGVPRTLTLPGELECIELRDKALEGDAIAIERIYQLYFNGRVPVTPGERTCIALIWDAHSQINKRLNHHEQEIQSARK